MNFFSFLKEKAKDFDKRNRFEAGMNVFLKSEISRELFERMITYMGYTNQEFNNNNGIVRRVQESFSLIVSRGFSYMLGDELEKSMAAIDINKEFVAVCACDPKFAAQFEDDMFRVFGIKEPHRFNLGKPFDEL